MHTGRMKLSGAIHAHTTLSHDGTMSLSELVDFVKARGYDYLAITEHSYDVDAEAMTNLRSQAELLSTPDFLIIPGLEFRCHGWIDIIGYGVTEPTSSENPAEVIDHIHRHGGVAIFAHPNIRPYPIDPSWVKMLDGAEIWNVSNEGKYLPQTGGINKFRELASVNPELRAYTGLDLHRRESYCYLSATTFASDRTKDDILRALKKGDFRSESFWLTINSDGDLSPVAIVRIAVLRVFLNAARFLRDLLLR